VFHLDDRRAVNPYELCRVEASLQEALDYLLKPLDDERFAACIDRARRMLALHRQEANFGRLYGLLTYPSEKDRRSVIKRFPIRLGNNLTFVQVGDVDWIEGLGDYAGLHVGGRTHLLRESLTWTLKGIFISTAAVTLRAEKTVARDGPYSWRLCLIDGVLRHRCTKFHSSAHAY
jgi:hypothetical protein